MRSAYVYLGFYLLIGIIRSIKYTASNLLSTPCGENTRPPSLFIPFITPASERSFTSFFAQSDIWLSSANVFVSSALYCVSRTSVLL